MTLLLDSSVLFELEKDNKTIVNRLKEMSAGHPARACISFMSSVEFLYGIEEKSDEEKAEAKEFLWKFCVLHTTNETAAWLAYLKHKYDKLGKPKSISGLFIASQALEHKLTLVTKDRDFEDISEIKKIIV
ncbi:tRNA(fMet)-specific endonuclease VapC [uncultured archaeon]|nr:tRNA(fMet)-specific endonuclease VapC [uncultured archaeon]